jgi:hypothetical protein
LLIAGMLAGRTDMQAAATSVDMRAAASMAAEAVASTAVVGAVTGKFESHWTKSY